MKFSSLVFSLCLSVTAFAESNAVVEVVLKPAGSYSAKTSEVTGFATLKGGTVTASNITVNLNSLKTGIELRDKHTKEHLQVDKHPKAILVSAQGTGGTGTGVIKIKGIEQKVKGTYQIKGNELIAKFPLSLKDFKISGVSYMGIGVKDEVKLTITVPLKK